MDARGLPDAELADAYRALAERLRHDVARYVALQARWLGPDAPVDALRAALREDLLATRRGPDGVATIAQVAGPLVHALRGGDGRVPDLGSDPVIGVFLAAIARIVAFAERLGDGTLPDADLAVARDAALDAASAARAATARLKELAEAHG
jgi:hypothetical protein